VEIVLFTVVGIVLYVVTGQLLNLLEKLHGNPLPQRNIIFFVIILALTLPTFSMLRGLLAGNEGAQNYNQEQQAPDSRNQPAEPH
jgi:hypothetical protein